MKHLMSRATIAALAAIVSAAAFAGSIEPGDHMEMAAVLKAPVTPTRAVKIAENGGGRAYNYGMEVTRKGQQWYDVDVLRGGAKLDIRIDPTSGRVIGSSAATGEGTQGARSLEGHKLTFGEAIAEAERVGNGPALEANAAGHAGNAHVNVDVIQDHGKRIAHYRVTEHDGQVEAVMTGADS